ncbi:MAG: hypothetical protein RR382_00280 [Tannerellaceae bacterium]
MKYSESTHAEVRRARERYVDKEHGFARGEIRIADSLPAVVERGDILSINKACDNWLKGETRSRKQKDLTPIKA